MNIIQVQDRLKGLSEQQLAQEMQMPTGMAPQFLVLSELQRRKRVRDDFQAQNAQAPQTTVAQDAVAAAGVPQAGIAPMAQALAPQTDLTQNTGIAALAPQAAPTEEPVQGMAHGGMVRKMQDGKIVRGGKTYILQPDGTYVSEDGSSRIMTPGQNIANDFSALGETISGLPAAAGQALGEYSAGIADDMNATLQQRMDEHNAEARRVRVRNIMDDFAQERTPTIEPYYPGPASATELNLPAFRPPVDAGAGFATPLREAAVAATPPEDSYQDRVDRTRAIMEEMAAAREPVAPVRRLPPAPDRSGTMGTNADRDLGPNSLASLPEVLQSGVRIGPDGSVTFTSPTPDAAAPELQNPAVRAAVAGEPTPEAAAAEDAAAAAPDTPRNPPGGGGGSGSGSGGGGMTSYEQAIADALARADKRANQDKWMALAQAGMALMASKQPTLGGALGEAGMLGLGAYRTSRDEAEKTKMDLMATQFEIDLARRKLAASGGGGGGGGGLSYNQYATRLGEYAKILTDELGTMVGPDGKPIPARKDDYERTVAELADVRDKQRALLGVSVTAGGEEEITDVPQP